MQEGWADSIWQKEGGGSRRMAVRRQWQVG